MRLPYKCPLCSRTFRTPQGRRGHLTFKHGYGKKSVYTEGIKKLIEAHKEGIGLVKEKRRRIPKSALMPEKRRKIAELTKDLEIEEEKRSEQEEERRTEDNSLSEGISLKGLKGLSEGINLKGFRGRWYKW